MPATAEFECYRMLAAIRCHSLYGVLVNKPRSHAFIDVIVYEIAQDTGLDLDIIREVIHEDFLVNQC